MILTNVPLLLNGSFAVPMLLKCFFFILITPSKERLGGWDFSFRLLMLSLKCSLSLQYVEIR